MLLKKSLELLKTVLADEDLFIRWEIHSEKFFIRGGLLEFILMYNGLLSGFQAFLYGLYLPVDTLSVKFR